MISSGRLTFGGEKDKFSELDIGSNLQLICNLVVQGDKNQRLPKLNGAPGPPKGPLEAGGQG